MKRMILSIAVAILLVTGCGQGNSTKQTNKTETTENTTANPGMHSEHMALGVNGSCDMCKMRIEKAAMAMKGVTSAHWDDKEQMLHLNFNPDETNLDAISKAVAKAGHDTDKDKANDATYNALPECCKYRK